MSPALLSSILIARSPTALRTTSRAACDRPGVIRGPRLPLLRLKASNKIALRAEPLVPLESRQTLLHPSALSPTSPRLRNRLHSPRSGASGAKPRGSRCLCCRARRGRALRHGHSRPIPPPERAPRAAAYPAAGGLLAARRPAQLVLRPPLTRTGTPNGATPAGGPRAPRRGPVCSAPQSAGDVT